MKKLIFITGGARSGKSAFAERLAQEYSGKKAYLATAQALDEEMALRIRRHKERRPAGWETLEEPIRVSGVIKENGDRFSLILVDCLTLWISNLMAAGWAEKEILEEGDRLIASWRGAASSLILVGNEVGMGIVPDNPLARSFRDLSGMIQQRISGEADEVYFLVSGLPQKLKGA